MLNHRAILSSMDAYADGSLPDAQRADVTAHLQTCAECGESLRQIQRLDHVLSDLPAVKPVPFSHFWSRLEPRLPNHAQKRAFVFRPAQLAAGIALAIIASSVGVVALASDGTLPDSPLYSVKYSGRMSSAPSQTLASAPSSISSSPSSASGRRPSCSSAGGMTSPWPRSATSKR